jgi:hypothetical protein
MITDPRYHTGNAHFGGATAGQTRTWYIREAKIAKSV